MAAAGWDGDRYELWRRETPPADCEYPCRADLVLVAKWAFDTAADSREFDPRADVYLEDGLGGRAASDGIGASTVAIALAAGRERWLSCFAPDRELGAGRGPRSIAVELKRSRRWPRAAPARHLLAVRRDDALHPQPRLRGDGSRLHPDHARGRGPLERLRGARRRLAGDPAATRRLGRWWLLGLLVAVFPANVHMASSPTMSTARGVPIDRLPRWLLWARLPIQPLFMLWAWRATE